jgi:competence protein ComEA
MQTTIDRMNRWGWRVALVATVAVLALLLAQGSSLAAAKKGLVNINTATQAELEAVKGVGPATAKKIIDNRPYNSLDDLKKAGLSAKKIGALKSSVTASEAAVPEEKKSARDAKQKGEAAAAAKAGEPAAAGPVDLNSADQKALEALPGIGPATAKKIIEARPFNSVDDLSKVKGMSKAKMAALKDKVTAGPARAAAPAAKPAAAAKAIGPKAAEPAAAGPVDLNTADQKALEALPGIGPATAKKIIEARPFNSVDDLSKVKGMSKAKMAALKDKVTAGPARAAAPEAKPAPAAEAPKAAPAAEAPAAAREPAPEAKPAAAEKEKKAVPKLAPGEKINLNTASKADLEKLLDIGPVRAQAIIDNRPYKKIEDVMRVKGIKEGIFGEIKDYIKVD